MHPLIAQLVAAAQALGAEVTSATVALLPSGNVTVRIGATTPAGVAELGRLLGCSAPEMKTNGQSEWICAEVGDYSDPLVLSVTGGHRPICQCHPIAAPDAKGRAA